MSKENDYEAMVSKNYHDLMEHCEAHSARMDRELPPAREDFGEALNDRGISRRSFMKWTAFMTSALMLPPVFKPMVAQAAENFSRLPIIWLHFAECTGCSESFLRSSYPNVDDLLLDTLSVEYHETLMAAAGHQAEENLQKAMKDFKGQYVCVIEGAIPLGLDGQYCMVGGKTALDSAREVTKHAAATICIGSCSSFGNVQAANPNPTDAVGVGKALGIKTVNIAGCPPSPANFVGTVLHFLMFGGMPPMDNLGRPIWAYGKRVHDLCERRPHYDAGEFVEEWGDEGARKGWCLYKMGCKGPYTYSNCAKVRFNDGMSWPIMAGHGCMGCVEPNFWDTMAPLEKPIADRPVGGIEQTVDKIGLGLTTLAAAGIAVHAGAAAIKTKSTGKNPSEFEDKQED